MSNKFIVTADAGIMLGKVRDNTSHHHYALQVVISLDGELELMSNETTFKGDAFTVQSQVPHQINTSNNQVVLVLLINLGSLLGHLLSVHLLNEKIEYIDMPWSRTLKSLANKWHKNQITDKEFMDEYNKLVKNLIEDHYLSLTKSKRCENESHIIDSRIKRALDFLDTHSDKVIPIEEVARYVNLSPSRFIHLFKDTTGISFRRMQLWGKLILAFKLIPNCSSLTELAHQSGFSDSAHFSRTFKQTFGIKASILFKNSQFIQF